MNKKNKFILKNGKLNSGDGFYFADIRICDGKIVEIGSLKPNDPSEEVIDITNKVVVAGLVDVHVHFREPGFSYKETIESGSNAAAAGGYTAVCTMPNLKPAPDSKKNINIQKNIIASSSKIKIYPLATITKGQRGKGELVDFEELGSEIGFSDDGKGVQGEDIMSKAMEEAAKRNCVIVAHCEVDELIKGGYIHDGEFCKKHNHRGICSESEWLQVERDVRLAKKFDCRYHACHISTAQSVEIIRKAKAEGAPVSCETAPHYLLLDDSSIEDHGRFKMNPPIREKSDKEALIEGIKDGTIDVIATDHAPHSSDEKSRGLAHSAFGIVGLETAFSLIYTYLVKKNIISFEKLIELMSINPRKIFGIEGGLTVGCPADIAIIDLDKESTIDPNTFLSKGRSTPFDGWKIFGKIEKTYVNGIKVFDNSNCKSKTID